MVVIQWLSDLLGIDGDIDDALALATDALSLGALVMLPGLRKLCIRCGMEGTTTGHPHRAGRHTHTRTDDRPGIRS